MITGYAKPQLLVRQLLQQLPGQQARSRHAFVFGPKFDLHRYTDEDEKEEMSGVLFVENTSTDPADRQVVPYEGLESYHIVDKDFVRLYAEQLEGQFWVATSPDNNSDNNEYEFRIFSLDTPNKLHVVRRGAVIQANNQSYGGVNQIDSASVIFGGSGYETNTEFDVPVVGGTGSGAWVRLATDGNGVVTSAEVISPGEGYTANVTFSAPSADVGANVGEDDDTLIDQLSGRPIQAGDVIYTTLNGETLRRTVKRVEKEYVSASYGVDSENENEQFAASPNNPIQSDSAVFSNPSAPVSWDVLRAHSSILDIEVLNGGTGYQAAPNVDIDEPIKILGALDWPTQQAAASAKVDNNGQVTDVSVDVIGAGYFMGGVVGFSITNAGEGYSSTTPPSLSVAEPNDPDGITAKMEPVLENGRIVDIRITEPGAGYDNHPTVTVIGGNPTTAAQIQAIVNLGSVQEIQVDDGGDGLDTNSTLSVTDPTGQPANITSGGYNITTTQQLAASIKSFKITDPVPNVGGANYQTGDILEISDNNAIKPAKIKVDTVTQSGAIDTLSIEDPGHWEGGIPTTTSAATTGGSGDGNATVDLKVALRSIIITAPGIGYTDKPTISFTGVGTQPQVTVVMAPAQMVTFSSNSGSGATAAPTILSRPKDWNGLIEGSLYDGQYGERYTLKVTKEGSSGKDARVRIRSASGGFSAEDAIAYKYGYGYVIKHSALGGLAVELRHVSASQPLTLGAEFSFVIIGKYKPLRLAAGGQVIDVNILHDGDGGLTDGNYALPVSSTPSGGVDAGVTVTVSGGFVTAANVFNPGSGYLVAPDIDVSVIPGNPTNPNDPVMLEAVISTPENNRDLTPIQGVDYNGSQDTQYQLTVVKGSNVGLVDNSFKDAKVRVSDTAGIDSVEEFTVQHDVEYALGSHGLKFIFPKDLLSPGGLKNGSTATGVAKLGVNSMSINTAGSSYQAGDVVTLDGGNGVSAEFTVDSVDGTGAVTALSISEEGKYTSLPSSSTNVSVTGGNGTGLTVDIDDWGVSEVTVSGGGSGYVGSPSVTFSGGNGSDAEVTAHIVDGKVFTVTVDDPGTGFTSQPSVTFEAPETYQSGLRTGDVYYINAVAKKREGPSSVVVLSGHAGDTAGFTEQDLKTQLLDIDARALYSGYIEPKRDTPPDLAWEAGDNQDGGILVKDNLKLELSSRDSNKWVPVKEGSHSRFYAHWRGLNPSTSTDSIKLYHSEQAIKDVFGAFDPDNPVCYAAIMAYRGGQQKSLFVMHLPTNDKAGYENILKQAERVEGIYAMAPTTTDYEIQQSVQAHVDKVSKAAEKLWRRAYIVTESPGKYPTMQKDSDGNNFTATVSATNAGNVRVVAPDADFLVRGIEAGDLFRINYSNDAWNEETYEEYEIQSVLENDELILKSGPSSAIDPAKRFEIWRPDTGETQAEFVGSRSENFGFRRTVNLWVDSPIKEDSDGSVQFTDLYYLAAEVAGLRSVMLPQQGLTRTELDHSVDRAPQMFIKYSDDELNIAAAKGTFIVTQEMEQGSVYIRHQLTTQSSKGSLYYEDSVGANLDAIAYTIKEAFVPYIGKRNATPQTLEELETKLRGILDDYKAEPDTLSDIGPALIDYTDLSLEIDEELKDRINVEVTLELPLPINTIVVTLKATTIQDDVVIETETSS